MRRILTLTAFVLAALSVTGQRTPEELLTQGYAEVDYITLAGEAGADTMLVTQPMPQYP